MLENIKWRNIKKVCGFLAKEETLKNLKMKFPEVEFCFAVIAKNDEEYAKEHWKLSATYHNRWEPIDEEHPYVVRKLNPVSDLEKVKEQMVAAIRSFYDGELNIGDNRYVSGTKVGFSIELLEPDIILKKLKKIDLNLFNIEKMTFRFKLTPEGCEIRINSINMVELTPSKLHRLHQMVFGKCGFHDMPQLCDGANFFQRRRKTLLDTTCTLCIDMHISRYLILELLQVIEGHPE